MEALTVNDLYVLCKAQRANGNGKKKILISGDDEGNSYHELFYGFSPTVHDGLAANIFDEACMPLPCGVTENEIIDYVTLG